MVGGKKEGKAENASISKRERGGRESIGWFKEGHEMVREDKLGGNVSSG